MRLAAKDSPDPKLDTLREVMAATISQKAAVFRAFPAITAFHSPRRSCSMMRSLGPVGNRAGSATSARGAATSEGLGTSIGGA